jgi:hypothetical protein
MAGLPRKHGDLAAMVGVVCDQVADESGRVRTESLDAPIASERGCEQSGDRVVALSQGHDGLTPRH